MVLFFMKTVIDENQELMTLNDACSLLKVHRNTLRNWTKEGKLKTFRIGERKDRRFRKRDIEELLLLEKRIPPKNNKNDLDYILQYEGKNEVFEIISETKRASVQLSGFYNNEGNIDPLNSLYFGDNLNILKLLCENKDIRGKVKLVYIDPPYSTKQVFKTKTQIHAYEDVLFGANYIEYIRKRLVLLKELLSEDGSIYVHLDQNMAFPIKLIMDELFGSKNFRNWITRKKCNPKNYTSKQYGNMQDFILFYTKTDSYIWNRPYEAQGIYNFEERYPKIEKVTGRRYALVPIHAPGIRNGETGKEWRGMMPPNGKHWQLTPEKLDKLDAEGKIYWSPTGNPRRKIFAEDDKGIQVQDVWLNFKDAHNQNIKVTGYPTEKNPEMLRRIISASTNEGDIVLDCFCGSGTTLAEAEGLGRKWIGIDNSKLAIKTTIKRLLDLYTYKKNQLKNKTIELFNKDKQEIKGCAPFSFYTMDGYDLDH